MANNNTLGSRRSLHVHMAESPPPPYSERDIYSNSGRPRSPNTYTTAVADDGASRVSSSTGGASLTPPGTPRTCSIPQLQPGAALYFESRPPPPAPARPGKILVHTVHVDSASSPDDFPYQAVWASRDVTAQDWATFVNFLVPDSVTRRNEAVIDKKLRAEDRADDAGASSGPSHAEAQLEQMRQFGPDAAPTREGLETTVQQWNDGFFGPRGISLRLTLGPSTDPARMPGSRDAMFDSSGHPLGQPRGLRDAGPSSQQQPSARTMNWGGLTVGDGHIRLGNKFVADGNGLRIGSLVVDNSGIRRDGHQGNEATTSRVFGGGHALGRIEGLDPSNLPCHGHQDHRQRDLNDYVASNSPQHWDQGRHFDHKSRRARSASPTSISSSSSSSSESSIGSLPSYRDVRDQQLPLYVARLRDWTSSGWQLRTKGDVKQLKADLKKAKSAPVDPKLDGKALRAQMEVLSLQWKQLKRRQKSARKAARRERRQRRKAEKRERKQNKRYMKGALRQWDLGRAALPMSAVPAPPAPPVPPAPPAPHAPHAPSAWVGTSHDNLAWHDPFRHRGYRLPRSTPNLFDMYRPVGPRSIFRERGPPGPHGLFGERGPHGRNEDRSLGGGGDTFGREGGPWSSIGRAAPGARPEDKKPESAAGQQTGVATTHRSGAVSAAKYCKADVIEAEMRRKAEQAAALGAGGDKDAMNRELESVESLALMLEQVRMEADEAYARELAAEEGH